jgi:hypothetical protein
MPATNTALVSQLANSSVIRNYCHTGCVVKANQVLTDAPVVSPNGGYKRYNKRMELAKNINLL